MKLSSHVGAHIGHSEIKSINYLSHYIKFARNKITNSKQCYTAILHICSYKNLSYGQIQ